MQHQPTRPRGVQVKRLIVLTLGIGLLAACASKPPAGLEPLQADSPGPRAAQSAPSKTVGEPVRWGGEILAVTNRALSTEIAIFSRPLFDNAEPKPDGGDGIRFLAVIDRFLDPAEYLPGKRLTVSGRLAGNREQAVGEYPYSYPVVEVEHFHLWPAYSAPVRPAYWRDPFYDPWWPWGPYRHWPYYR